METLFLVCKTLSLSLCVYNVTVGLIYSNPNLRTCSHLRIVGDGDIHIGAATTDGFDATIQGSVLTPLLSLCIQCIFLHLCRYHDVCRCRDVG